MVVTVAEEFVFCVQLIAQLILDVDSDNAPIRGGTLDLEEELEKNPRCGVRAASCIGFGTTLPCSSTI